MPNVPDTTTFTLQNVYDSVHGHAPGTLDNLDSCFDNAVFSYFDPAYNNDTYNGSTLLGMKRFRNYHPSGVATTSFWEIIINDNTDAGKSTYFNFFSWSSDGNFYTAGAIPITASPSRFYNNSGGLYPPTISDTYIFHLNSTAGTSTKLAFNPAVGNTMAYLVSNTLYTAADINTIIANMTPFASTLGFWASTDYWNSTLAPVMTAGQHLYIIYDYRTNATPPTYRATGTNFEYNSENAAPFNIAYTGTIQIQDLFDLYVGAPYATLVIDSINNNSDGDAYDYSRLKIGANVISTFPTNVNITGLVETSASGITFAYTDVNGNLLNNIPRQLLSVTFHIVDTNGQSGPSRTSTMQMAGYSTNLTSATATGTTTATITGLGYGNAFGKKGFYWNYTMPVDWANEVQVGTTVGTYTYNWTGLSPGTTYWVRSYVIYNTGNGVLGGNTLSFTTDTTYTQPTGYLMYNAYTALSPLGIVALGWSVPSISAYTSLMSSFSYTDIKSTTSWTTPGTNNSNFNAKSNGGYSLGSGNIYGVGVFMLNWTTTTQNSSNTYHFGVQNDNHWTEYVPNTAGGTLRAIRNSGSPNGTTGVYIGNDGKGYPTVVINGVEWTTIDLQETKFRDGSNVVYSMDAAVWTSQTAAGLPCATS